MPPLVPILAVGAGLWLLAKASEPQPDPHQQLFDVLDHYLDRAASLLGVDTPPLYLDFGVANAQANGWDVRINPVWARGVLRDLGSAGWPVLFWIMAHELAHHVLLHPQQRQQARLQCPHYRSQELEADDLATQIAIEAGYGWEDVSAVRYVLGELCSCTHPSGPIRLRVVRRVYERTFWYA